MRRTFAASLVALMLTAAAGLAAADPPRSRARAPRHDDALADLSARARESNISLDRRREAAAPVVEDTETFRPQPLPARLVQQVVAERHAEIRHCFDRAAARGKAPAGGLVSVRFVVEPRGVPQRVEVAAGDAALETCIAQRIRKWRFPMSNGETEVEIPFAFGSR